MFSHAVPGPYYAAMLERPNRNPRIKYWEKRGFVRIGQAEEVLQARFMPSEYTLIPGSTFLWGIYVLSNSGYRPLYTSAVNRRR